MDKTCRIAFCLFVSAEQNNKEIVERQRERESAREIFVFDNYTSKP